MLARVKYREAWWQLTEDERQSVGNKIRKSREGTPVKRLVRFAVGPDHIVVNGLDRCSIGFMLHVLHDFRVMCMIG